MDNEVMSWEKLYSKGPFFNLESPHEEVEFLHELFKKNNVETILDLGCGDGRHLYYFSKLGYRIYGLDNARTGLCLAQERLAQVGLATELVCADMTAIPWHDEFFGAVIVIQVIYHNPIEGIRRTIEEIHRVLKPGGWLFVTVSTCKPLGPMRYYSGVEIEPGTMVMDEGPDKGVPHHFFTMPELLDELSRFALIDLRWDSYSGACLLFRRR
ncbi:MAG: methyltransferase domain-containing protein [Dehalococcoidales bacterium]|nr:MAG: methyltransferase domain-containing protein [Dehalococcoidales bacterium]